MDNLTREDFKQLYYIDKEIEAFRLEIEDIETHGTHCTQILSDMPRGTSTGNKIESAAVDAVSVEEIVKYAMKRREVEYRKLIELINSINDAEMRVLLFYRYVRGLAWIDVAKKMNSTIDAVKQKDKRFFQKNKSDTSRHAVTC